MIELITPFIVAGLTILWFFGIRPELEKRKGNTKVCDDFYRSKGRK